MNQPTDASTEAQRQRPWDTGVRTPLPAEAGFSPQEHWAWARIIRGEQVDMRLFPATDPAAQAAGAYGDDDGGGEDPAAAESWPAHRDLSARFMRTILFHEPWASARARPYVRIVFARFPEELDWENESFPGELGLYGCLFSLDANWMGLRVDRLLNLNGSRFDGALLADRMVVEGSLFCRNGFSAKGDVRLLGGRVGGVAAFEGAHLEGALHADAITIKGTLFCRNGFSAKGDIRLPGARVGGNAEFDGATLDGALRADGLVVEGDCFLRDMTKLTAADLLGARIGQDLQLLRSVIDGTVNLTGAEIEGELNLAHEKGAGPTWGPGARLVLRNARAGALAGGLDAFRRGKDFVSCDLAGFAYERIGGLGAGADGSTLASAGGANLRAWLRCCRPSDHFDPAPYRALARGLADAGRADRAADIRNALGNYEMVAKGTPLMQRFMLMLSWLFIGYGERNHRAFIWFVVLVCAAAGWGYWHNLAWPSAHAPSGWGDAQAWRDWVGFAFGDAVPVVTFDEAHKSFLADRFCDKPDDGVCRAIPTGLTGFYYAVKVAGFIILSYLAAGLSGLAQHRD
jgi:hypothetical protein